jgi:hypothetical protein
VPPTFSDQRSTNASYRRVRFIPFELHPERKGANSLIISIPDPHPIPETMKPLHFSAWPWFVWSLVFPLSRVAQVALPDVLGEEIEWAGHRAAL